MGALRKLLMGRPIIGVIIVVVGTKYTIKQHTGPKRISNNMKPQNDNSVNLKSTTTASNSTQTTSSSTKHDDKVNALAAVMSYLASTSQQPSSNFAASISRNQWSRQPGSLCPSIEEPLS